MLSVCVCAKWEQRGGEVAEGAEKKEERREEKREEKRRVKTVREKEKE
jgi:hypothetical protein